MLEKIMSGEELESSNIKLGLNPIKGLWLTIGPSGSGKTTYAKDFCEKFGIIYLSSDELRAHYGWGQSDQTVSGKVFKHIEISCNLLMSQSFPLLVDATFYTKKHRKKILEIAKVYGYYTTALYFDTCEEECKRRNKLRERQVPDHVIEKQVNNLDYPKEFDTILDINADKIFRFR